MSTLSVPLTPDLEGFINSYIKQGHAENKAQVVRKALNFFSEHQAIEAVFAAEKEVTLHGDLRELMKKFK